MLERFPALGQKREAALARAARRAERRVARPGAEAQLLDPGGLPDRAVNTAARAFVAGSASAGRPAGNGRSTLRTFPQAAARSWTLPGSASETHSGMPRGVNNAWMFPPKSWVFPEYHTSIVSPLRLILDGKIVDADRCREKTQVRGTLGQRALQDLLPVAGDLWRNLFYRGWRLPGDLRLCPRVCLDVPLCSACPAHPW